MVWWAGELLSIDVFDDMVLLLFMLGMLSNVHDILPPVLTLLKVSGANSSFLTP